MGGEREGDLVTAGQGPTFPLPQFEFESAALSGLYDRQMAIEYEWRGEFDNTALDALHAEGFGHPVAHTDWRERLERHSLGWVCAWEDGSLIGFVNVAWDGGVHAFPGHGGRPAPRAERCGRCAGRRGCA